jgi:hypothetical protein
LWSPSPLGIWSWLVEREQPHESQADVGAVCMQADGMVEDMAEDMRRLEATATAQHAELSEQAAHAEQSAGALRKELDANCAAMATMEAQMRHMEKQVRVANLTLT